MLRRPRYGNLSAKQSWWVCPSLLLTLCSMQPANDITYLDDTLRITRGGDDSLFIFRRGEGPRAMLSPDERAVLYGERGAEAVLFGGAAAGERGAVDEQPGRSAPELRKLTQR